MHFVQNFFLMHFTLHLNLFCVHMAGPSLFMLQVYNENQNELWADR